MTQLHLHIRKQAGLRRADPATARLLGRAVLFSLAPKQLLREFTRLPAPEEMSKKKQKSKAEKPVCSARQWGRGTRNPPRGGATAAGLHLQGQVVEAHGPQGEGPGQQAHVREQNPDGVLELGQLLQDRRRLDQLPVRLRLLDLKRGVGEDERAGSRPRAHQQPPPPPFLGFKRSISAAAPGRVPLLRVQMRTYLPLSVLPRARGQRSLPTTAPVSTPASVRQRN